MQNRYTAQTIIKLALIAFVCLVWVTPAKAQVTGLSDYEIFLDPGHCQKENMGLYNYSEAEKVLRVALEMKAMFENQTDIKAVHMSRLTDSDYQTLSGRSDLANSLGADFYYSIHSNASQTSDVFTMYGGWKNDGVVIEKTPNGGRAYGDILNVDMAGATRLPIHGMGNYPDRVFYYPYDNTHENQYPYLSVNRRTNMASILSETGSHTNMTQQQLNVNAEWKRQEALAAFRSFLEFKNLDRPAVGIAAGIITDAKTGTAINGVTVTIGNSTYTTDTYKSLFYNYTSNPEAMHNGFYWIEGLTPGDEVDVVFTSDSYMTKTVPLTIASNPNGRTAENISFLDVQLVNSIPAIVTSVEVEGGFSDVMPGMPIAVVFSREMNRPTVEEAITISPVDSISLTWYDDFTLEISTDSLDFSTDFTITIDGSIAKNTESDQFFDGDNDGVEGGNYQIQLNTSPPDLAAPVLVDNWPSETQASTEIRPVIRMVFDEEVAASTVSASSIVVSTVNGGTEVAGTISHNVVGDQSVLHFFPKEDLVNDASYDVEISGLEDLHENAAATMNFTFTVEELAIVDTTYIDTFDLGITGWGQPTATFSTKGVVRAETNCVYEQDIVCEITGSTQGSMKLNYEWVEGYSNPYLRAILSSSSTQNANRFNVGDVLQMYLFGDGSNNQYRFMLKDGNIQTEASQWHSVNWKGWKLLSWDLSNDPVFGWSSGNGVLDGSDFYFDGIHMQNDGSGGLKDAVFFDDLRFVTLVSTTVVNDNDADMQVNVYPNPASDVLNIKSASIIEQVSLYNMTGQMVMHKDCNQLSIQLSIGHLREAVYIVKITSNSSVVNRKIKLTSQY